MPLIRKIIPVGKTSKAVILPKSWLDYFESELGTKIRLVSVEVDRKLEIMPYVPKGGAAHNE